MESKMLNKDEILKNLKGGIDDLNTKFDSEDWDQIEVRVSEFENEVLKCLMVGYDSQPTQMPVIGETMYQLIKEKFKKELSQFMSMTVKKENTDNTNIDSDESNDGKTKKKKKEKKPVVKKADLFRQENAISSVTKQITQVLDSFNENKMISDFGLYTNKIIELRGLTFIYMAWFVLNSKSASEYYQKKSKLPEVYELMCSMQRFINTCKDYSGKSLSNNIKSIPNKIRNKFETIL